MQGIADGASVTLGDILALNARSEIALTVRSEGDQGHPPDGCTAFSKLTKPSKEQYLGQNWDWKESQLNNIIVLMVDTPAGLRLATVTEVRIVGKVGMNTLGVGVTLNALKPVQMDPTKLRIHIALRLVLESSSVPAAVQRLNETGVASAAHFLIADGNTSIGVEVNPVWHALLEPNKHGEVFHTNHCISTNLPSGLTEVPWLADGVPRLSRVEGLVRTIPDRDVGFASLFEIFKDGAGLPNAINRAVGPETNTAICTVFNILMNNSTGQMYIYFGRPTEWIEALDLSLQDDHFKVGVRHK